MNAGRTIFSQLMDFAGTRFSPMRGALPRQPQGQEFSCRDQYLCMAFAQLTYRESLRDIEACLRLGQPKLYHMGFRGKVSRNTLADANQVRDWRIYADFAQILIGNARQLYADDPFGVELDQTVYALDSTTIDLCLSLFPWATIPQAQGRRQDAHAAGSAWQHPDVYHHHLTARCTSQHPRQDPVEAGAFYVMDRGYLDFAALRSTSSAFFVTRAKTNFRFQRRYSHPVDKPRACSAIRPSCTERLLSPEGLSREAAAHPLLRSRADQDSIFLTNNFTLPALTIARSTSAAGRSSCSSNGSSSTCGSRPSTAPPRTP